MATTTVARRAGIRLPAWRADVAIVAVAALLLAYLTVVPLVMLLLGAVSASGSALDFQFTTRYLERVLTDQASLELMRSYAASELAIFGKVRVPNALPYIFTAFKVSATLSLIGAIVAEYFGGSRSVLGQFIITEAAFFRFANAWAAIVVASAVSIAFFLIIVAIERVAIPWHASARITDAS